MSVDEQILFINPILKASSNPEEKDSQYSIGEKKDGVKKGRGRRGGKGKQSNTKPLAEQNVNTVAYVNAN